MHERSLVRSLIEQVNEELRNRSLGPLRGIRLELGEFSGVEPSLLQLAFDEMARDAWGHDVKLDLEIISLSAQCLTCDKIFQVEGFRFVCPDCHGTDVQIRSGEQMQLVSLDVESANNSGSSTA